ncbi:MAG: sensor histidine kinase [Butyricicoccus sp.]
MELSALCDTVATACRARRQKGHACASREKGCVSGQRRTLEQMIFNLTDNAINYNKPQGSVTLTTGTENGRPFVQVSDTGIGIAPADQQRVFERFYRVDKSHSKMTGGTGLGLSIVKHGAALHHAEVELKSALGEGTCITLRFPKE